MYEETMQIVKKREKKRTEIGLKYEGESDMGKKKRTEEEMEGEEWRGKRGR